MRFTNRRVRSTRSANEMAVHPGMDLRNGSRSGANGQILLFFCPFSAIHGWVPTSGHALTTGPAAKNAGRGGRTGFLRDKIWNIRRVRREAARGEPVPAGENGE